MYKKHFFVILSKEHLYMQKIHHFDDVRFRHILALPVKLYIFCDDKFQKTLQKFIT